VSLLLKYLVLVSSLLACIVCVCVCVCVLLVLTLVLSMRLVALPNCTAFTRRENRSVLIVSFKLFTANGLIVKNNTTLEACLCVCVCVLWCVRVVCVANPRQSCRTRVSFEFRYGICLCV